MAAHARNPSIDALRGLVMVVMALDHARDYWAPTPFDPTNVASDTTPLWFFMRWVTHFCAPVFVFLAGTSAFFKGRKVGPRALSRWLVVRGLWIVLLEITVNNALWWGGVWPTFGFSVSLQVLWAIGASMLALGLLCRLPRGAILIVAAAMIAGHNLLDSVGTGVAQSSAPLDIAWSLLHVQNFIPMDGWTLFVLYPVVPWVGVMAAGYVFGSWFVEIEGRARPVFLLGLALTVAFVVLRFANVYGDPSPWVSSERGTLYTVLDALACTKYPPSLLFLLMTLGPSLMLLAWFGTVRAGVIHWLTVYGRVPLFFYFAHMVVIHGVMLIAAASAGRSPAWWFLVAIGQGDPEYVPAASPALHIWGVAVFALYPACYAWGLLKRSDRHRWADWL